MVERHQQDEMELAQLYAQLRERREHLGVSGYRLALDNGLPTDFVRRLEDQVYANPQVGTLQRWARLFDLRLEVGLENFWLMSWPASTAMGLWAMSRPWGNDAYARLWLVSALRQWRERRGVSEGQMGQLLGVSSQAVVLWEQDTVDPRLTRMMWQARLSGTRVTFTLWRRDDWIFQ